MLYIAGVDEAGRGPLAGPVISAAVILDPKKRIKGLNDSKQLTFEQREDLFEKIIQKAIAFAIGCASVEEIDELNILQATLLSMQRAVMNLSVKPGCILVDGNQIPVLNYPIDAIVDGDQKIPAISAASIIAKVTRDREMIALDKQYPGYGFAKHKGYATEQHQLALKQLGPCLIHRKSFMPIRLLNEQLNEQRNAQQNEHLKEQQNAQPKQISKVVEK